MIRTIQGRATHILPDGIVVEAGGVGYLVRVPPRNVPQTGEAVQYFTYHQIREDGQALYGFATLGELELFTSLLTVPSIGPKLALAILASAAPGEIIEAVDTDNIGFFQSLPGVGKKSAAKIIVELKGKVSAQAAATIPTRGAELIEALAALGYRPDEVQSILREVPAEATTVQQQVAWALKQLGQTTRA